MEIDLHKRFLVFAWDCYYPSGGFNDLQTSFDSLEVVKQYFTIRPTFLFDFYTVFDQEAKEMLDFDFNKEIRNG